jgi:hypothetical protein
MPIAHAIITGGTAAHPSRTGAALLPVILSIVAGTLSITAAEWKHQSNAASTGDVQYLIPELLIGNRWPLDSRYHPDLKALETGNWMVVIVRRDCPHCKKFLGKHFADPMWHRPGERTAVFVAGTNQWHFQIDRVSLATLADPMIEWPETEPFVSCPSRFLLENKKVNFAEECGKPDNVFVGLGFN